MPQCFIWCIGVGLCGGQLCAPTHPVQDGREVSGGTLAWAASSAGERKIGRAANCEIKACESAGEDARPEELMEKGESVAIAGGDCQVQHMRSFAVHCFNVWFYILC